MRLATTLFGTRHEFANIKELLAKAGEERSGDRLAGLVADSAEQRAAAKFVLAEVTLETLRHSPAVPYDEDEITRLIDDGLSETVYAEIKGMQVGELREWLLADTTTEEMIRRLSNGLTSEMVAAVLAEAGIAVERIDLGVLYRGPTDEAVLQLTNLYHNLMRRWADA